jgi:cytosine/adenosine deaminase-related metal-dependent hydrolase
MIRTVHRAKYVLAEADLLLQNAAVHVSDPGRISRVEPWVSAPPSLETRVIDWGSAVILPGLVNAHCHLELTDLRGRIVRFRSFPDWLSQLVRLRGEWTDNEYRESVTHGIQLTLRSGTTLIGDISASGLSWELLRQSPLRKVVFEEVLGLSESAVPAHAVRLQELFQDLPEDRLALRGVSPHAPYTVSPGLCRMVTAMARERSLPVAIHLAETRAEREFLQDGSGELRDFLSGLGALPDGWQPPHLEPTAFLESLNVLSTTPVLVHCNYLEEPAIARILASRASVVYCPRSHVYFGHDTHPVRQLLDAGVNVALGTDSLASNESLSVLDEMRLLHDRRGDLKAEEVFRMATLNGAAALHFGGVIGRLRRGYWADMTVLELPATACGRNLPRRILEGAGECIATIVGGKIAWQRDP